MSRYMRAPGALWDDNYPLVPELHVADHRPVNTGLVYRDGSPILRAPNPMGFGRDREW